MCQFSSKSSSKSVSEVRKTRFWRFICSSALCPKLLIIAHVTPWVHFRRNQSVNLRNNVSEVRKTLFFDGLSGFMQLGVVLETSYIAHVSPWVHTFIGKKEFFKSIEKFFKFEYTYTYIVHPSQILLSITFVMVGLCMCVCVYVCVYCVYPNKKRVFNWFEKSSDCESLKPPLIFCISFNR